MIVVADAGPVRYLVVIGAVGVLQPLYGHVLVPEAVAAELQETKTPTTVRAWIAQPPAWCQICPNPRVDPTLDFLDPGERAAISLAVSVGADRLLIDDWNARAEAERRQLHAMGTLGVLADAHLAGLLDFETAMMQLRCTNFYISDAVVEGIRQRLAQAKEKP